MKIEYRVLCTANNQQRIDNVAIMKSQLPSLQITMSGMDGLFERYIETYKISDNSTGLVFFDDDVQLCKNFQSRCEETISEYPNSVISMFESACSKSELKTEWRKGRIFAWNQCNYFPKSVCDKLYDWNNVAEFKEWYFKHYKTWTYPSDTYIAFTLNKYKIDYLMKLPFLVQHLDFKSALGKRPTNRQTKYFIDDLED